jgi:DNA-binding NarL/FixJ family response regulator
MLLLSVIPPRPELAEALVRLTSTQVMVAEYAAAGATVKEIADVLDRSPETVRSHLKNVYRLMWVANRVELAQLLRRTAISHGA